jgi:hypothetical protein
LAYQIELEFVFVSFLELFDPQILGPVVTNRPGGLIEVAVRIGLA